MLKYIITEKLRNIIDDYTHWLRTLGKFTESRKIHDALDGIFLDVLFRAISESQGNSDQDKIIVNSLIFSIQAYNSLYEMRRNLDYQEKNPYD